MKVQVVSQQTIKPATPTPPHLSSMPLSMLDQVAPSIYTQILLFYSAGGDGPLDKAAHLKCSLSLALTHFYPLAGRIRGPLNSSRAHVECNDEGVEFFEARVEGELAAVLRQPPMEGMHHLLPNGGDEAVTDGRPLLAVQFNRFDCGGSALGVSISHLVADGASMTMLLNGWADAACGGDLRHQPRFHAASVFPPVDIPAVGAPAFFSACSEAGATPKRFLIGGPEMEKLRGGTYARGQLPTRVEAVSTLVWRCATRAARRVGPQVAVHSVNLRKKMGEKVGENSFGNLWGYAAVLWEGGDDESSGAQGCLEKKMRDAVGEVDEERVKVGVAGWVLPEISEGKEMGLWVFSSWCRFSLYEVDVGWGKPAWVCCALRDMKNVGIFMDAKGAGEGMEVWLWLGREEMERFERDPEVLQFLSPPMN